MEVKIEDVLSKLRQTGLKRTQARRAILNVLVEEHGPFSSEEIYQRLKSHGCDLVTIYRNVISLEKVGLLKSCDFGDRIKRYELLDESYKHQHIACKVCGKIDTVNYALPKSVLSVLRKKGYAEVEAKLEFVGVCPDCAATTH